METEKLWAQMTWSEVIRWIFHILSYPLFELDGHAVSLGKLTSGLVMLVFAYIFSKRASREVDQRLLVRLSIEDSLRYSLKKFNFYLFMAFSTLFILHTLNVPITIFTVVGGALAVGIGFGSQNLVNNFISGVLVMLERPMRVHDFVEIDGVAGQIEAIGIRSTVVRTGQNAFTVMPNTTFIEKNLTNWSRSGSFAAAVRIGVAYGTDTKLMETVALTAAQSVPGVLSEPAPTLVFIDFGDNALIFDVAYSVSSEDFPRRREIASKIRFALNDLMLRHKIEVPYPQRDLRLRSEGPLAVKVLN